MDRVVLSAAVLLTMLVGLPVDTARADRAVEILEKARDTVAELRSISYRATVLGEGVLAKRRNIVDGFVHVKRGKGSVPDKVFIEGTTISQSSRVVGFRYATDGQSASSLYDYPKIFRIGGPKDVIMRERSELLPQEYLSAAAFDDELNSQSLKYEGTKDVEGVVCHVLNVTYRVPGLRTARIYIGKDDHLIHRTERPVRMRAGGPNLEANALLVFTVRDLKANVEIEDAVFRMTCPPGYESKSLIPKRKPKASSRSGALPAAELTVFLSHQPPRNTACDLARGRHVGSQAIRECIEEHQPDLVLCGHIHEAIGCDRIGNSLIVNPGPWLAGNLLRLRIESGEIEFRPPLPPGAPTSRSVS